VKPKVLIVDDDEFSPQYLSGLLGNHFEFAHASSGERALIKLGEIEPAVILLDVEMPGGMNGYQACRAIKDNSAWRHIPVFFISAHSAAEDRLMAYQSGGDDYVSKPYNAEEIRYKINLALSNHAKRTELAEKVRTASRLVMSSIREAASAGAVLGFLSEIVRLTKHEDIIDATLHALGRFQMEGAVQLRAGAKSLSRNSNGECSAVEDAVLTSMATGDRIVDLDTRSAFNYERASIITYNMPLQDLELYGRLKDTIVKMAEALDVHMRALDGVNAAVERGDILLKQLNTRSELARDVQARLKAQRDDTLRALKQLSERVQTAATSGDAQKELLLALTRDIQSQAQTVARFSAELDKLLATLGAAAEDPQPQTTAPSPTAGGARFNSVELF
jgi:CheY-like chemotaxis protein